MTAWVLASASPRRRELLALLCDDVEVFVTEVDETPRPGEAPRSTAQRLAVDKARRAATQRPDALVIAADTVVDLDGRSLGKPADDHEARAMLRDLSGRTHRVHTGVAVAETGRVHELVVSTAVTFVDLDPALIDAYVASGEPADKAGAYGIQGRGGRFVETVSGSYHNVVGLPVAQLAELLRSLGRLPADR